MGVEEYWPKRGHNTSQQEFRFSRSPLSDLSTDQNVKTKGKSTNGNSKGKVDDILNMFSLGELEERVDAGDELIAKLEEKRVESDRKTDMLTTQLEEANAKKNETSNALSERESKHMGRFAKLEETIIQQAKEIETIKRLMSTFLGPPDNDDILKSDDASSEAAEPPSGPPGAYSMNAPEDAVAIEGEQAVLKNTSPKIDVDKKEEAEQNQPTIEMSALQRYRLRKRQGGGQLRPPKYSLGAPSRRGKSTTSSTLSIGGTKRRRIRRTIPGYGQRGVAAPSHLSFNGRPHDEFKLKEPQWHQQSLLSSKREVVIGQSQSSAFSHESIKSDVSVAMQERIDSLEREKMELVISNAPLEARIRQKEDAWVKEHGLRCAETENHKMASKEADKRYRELEMKNEAFSEQNSRLLLEARAAASTVAGGTAEGCEADDSWNERVNGNKKIKDLLKERKNQDDEIKSLRIEKVSLESEVFGCQQELETLEGNYDVLEKENLELNSFKSQNRDAELQLQALTTVYTIMAVQLNETCADLKESKTHAKAKEDIWKNRESKLLSEIGVLQSRVTSSSANVTMDGKGD